MANRTPPLVWPGGRSTTAEVARFAASRLWDQLRILFPIALYLILFRFAALQLYDVPKAAEVVGGLLAVVLGLAIFLEGLEWGLMAIGEKIGRELPVHAPMWVTLTVAFILGVGVTFAEPAIASLQPLGKLVDPNDTHSGAFVWVMFQAPYVTYLVLAIGTGVGIGAVVGTLRFAYGFPMSPLIYGSLLPALGLTVYMTWFNKDLPDLVGLAWDSGAVTTGPVTVPIVLALGIGVASAGKGTSAIGGFGVVTLASLFPIIAVQILGIAISFSLTREEILEMYAKTQTVQTTWDEEAPYKQVFGSLQAVLPLIFFLIVVQKLIVKRPLPRSSIQLVLLNWHQAKQQKKTNKTEDDTTMHMLRSHSIANQQESLEPPAEFVMFEDDQDELEDWDWESIESRLPASSSIIFVGLVLVWLGMLTFSFGIDFGLQELGEQTGSEVPTMFAEAQLVEEDAHSTRGPLYERGLGIMFAVVFAFFLGLLATLAEPALNVLGGKVEALTQGAFSARLLLAAVATGVAGGIAIGVLKIIYDIELVKLLIPLYTVAVVLTMLSPDDFVGVAWDSAGVTTGPITVPLILAMGVALGDVLNVGGFGILAMASVGPICSVLLTNLVTSHLAKRRAADIGSISGSGLLQTGGGMGGATVLSSGDSATDVMMSVNDVR